MGWTRLIYCITVLRQTLRWTKNIQIIKDLGWKVDLCSSQFRRAHCTELGTFKDR